MNISRVLVYAQSTEDSKLSRITDILRGVETNVCFGSAKDDHKMRDSSTISDKGKEPTKNPFQGTINIPPSRGHSYDLQVNKKAYPHKGTDMLWFPFSVNLHRDYGLLLSRGVLLIVGLWVFVSSLLFY